jgi:hypothetical protein
MTTSQDSINDHWEYYTTIISKLPFRQLIDKTFRDLATLDNDKLKVLIKNYKIFRLSTRLRDPKSVKNNIIQSKSIKERIDIQNKTNSLIKRLVEKKTIKKSKIILPHTLIRRKVKLSQKIPTHRERIIKEYIEIIIQSIYEIKKVNIKKLNFLIDHTYLNIFPENNAAHIKQTSHFNKKYFNNIEYLYKYINIIDKITDDDIVNKAIITELKEGLIEGYDSKNDYTLHFVFYKSDDDLNSLSFINPKDSHIIDSIINYLMIFEYFFRIYLHIKETSPELFQVIDEYANKYEQLFKIDNKEKDKFDFLAKADINNKTNRKKITYNNAHIILESDYLNYKFCLANSIENDNFDNLYHPDKDNKDKDKDNLISNISEFFSTSYERKYEGQKASKRQKRVDNPANKQTAFTQIAQNLNLITTFNLQTKKFDNKNFKNFIDSLIDSMENSVEIKHWINVAYINCFQEVNIISFNKFLNESINIQVAQSSRAASNAAISKTVKVVMDTALIKYRNNRNIRQFLTTNNLNQIVTAQLGPTPPPQLGPTPPPRHSRQVLKIKYEIPIYKVFGSNKECVLISNRLANYNDDHKIIKGNLTCIEGEINNNDIFIGKLGAGYENNNIHTFIAIKKHIISTSNYDIIINLHLDTDDTNRLKQLELIYLLKYIIPKYIFFNNTNVNDIYIIGDLNMDCYEIITHIRWKVNNKFYKNKRFQVVLNNITTQASSSKKKSALDNCIIIKTITSASSVKTKCSKYTPQIYVSESHYSGEAKRNLPDHSLIIIKDINPTIENLTSSSPLTSEISKTASIPISLKS